MSCCLLAAVLISLFTPPAYAGDPKVYLKKYEHWLLKNRDPKIGLTYSHVGDKRLAHWISTYDSSVTALAFIALDRTKDAKRIVDFYMNNPRVWRLNGIITTINPKRPELGEEWSVLSGPNIWMGIASFHLYKSTGELKYLTFAKDRADFALFLQNTNPEDKNFGAIRMGPLGDKNLPGDQHIQYKKHTPDFYGIYPTEHAVDAYALFNLLADETGLQRYATGRSRILGWLHNTAFDKNNAIFIRGARPNLDPVFATDVQAWAVSALGCAALNAIQENLAFDLVKNIEHKALHTVEFIKPDGANVRVSGVDYIDKLTASALGRSPMISPEWTFELINAYARIENDLTKKQSLDEAQYFRNKKQTLLNQMFELTVETQTGAALPYATQYEASVGHGFRTPAKGNYSSIGVAYGILAITGFDPLYEN